MEMQEGVNLMVLTRLRTVNATCAQLKFTVVSNVHLFFSYFTVLWKAGGSY